MSPDEQNKKDEHYDPSYTVAAAIIAAIIAAAVWLIVVNIGLLNAGVATGVSMLLWVVLASGLIAESKKESKIRNRERPEE